MKRDSKQPHVIWLQTVNQHGEYVTLNEKTGVIHCAKRGSGPYMFPSKFTVARVVYDRARGVKMDDWFMDAFATWEREFARSNLDEYNRLINLDLAVAE